MNPFEAYQLFQALKLHFTTDYDYFKYQGKTNCKLENFETRNDKYKYYKLGLMADPVGFLVSNFVDGKVDWIGNMFSAPRMKIYREWCKRKEGLTYHFRTDLGKLPHPLQSALVVDGGYPKLLKLVQRKQISLETLILLEEFLNFFDDWDKMIDDTIIWPNVKFKCQKYRPFIEFDQKKIKHVIVSV